MHDLNTINRLNLEAFAESINAHRKAGRFVLAQYEGLSLVSIETFSYQNQAQDAFDAAVPLQHGGSRIVLFTPIGLAELATAPARAPDQTLADYIERKSDAIAASDC